MATANQTKRGNNSNKSKNSKNSKNSRSSGSNRNYSNRSNNSSNRRQNNKSVSRNTTNNISREDYEETILNPDIAVLLALAFGIFLFLCNLHIIGELGDFVASVMFGLFGMLAYAVPVVFVLVVFFGYLAKENASIRIRLISCIIFFILCCMLLEEIGGTYGGIVRDLSAYSIKDIWENGSKNRAGGGLLFGSITYLMNKYLDVTGTMLIIIVLMVICIMVLLGKKMLNDMKYSSRDAYSQAMEGVQEKGRSIRSRIEEEADNEDDVFEKAPRYTKKKKGIGIGLGRNVDDFEDYNGEEYEEVETLPRRERKVRGVMQDTSIKTNKSKKASDDMHEIKVDDSKDEVITEKAYARANNPMDEMAEIKIHGYDDSVKNNQTKNSVNDLNSFDETNVSDSDIELARAEEVNIPKGMENITFNTAGADKQTDIYDEKMNQTHSRVRASVDKATVNMDPVSKQVVKSINKQASRVHKKYKMPSVDLLNKGMGGSTGSSKDELMKTAMTLQETLETFGVKAKVTDISQGPSVTRFELQPEVGVRVNKIVSLADDLKLSLAATDIRIEAPIPGKSAVGIEVPNKVSTAVSFRELIEDRAFKNFDSKIAFAVGKDIAGNVVVTDIAKMPHMLIAGATGSGKSVCINTIIMSILYKAHPDDVKLIMVDPKVVELSVYNGIPHLMVPVVTDPKKAAAALHWGVAEMTKRYQLFAERNVRDLKGYNKVIEGLSKSDDPDAPKKLPQIVIIVDELADLMMVAAKEVEESICRLAQLARACGIHLIIATQRPSVDVITGLIKANMPSRVAFAVSSGVDSRTILDMNGAEKLLGKGDMLFYPQGYPKPARVQGAFISDGEVSNVVSFLKEQDYGNDGQDELLIKMNQAGNGSLGTSMAEDEDDRDDLFAQAGMFIIEQEKASIGSLQRKFKIGFNRAARIMDQLCEAGVVGGEEGTKARQILMGPEQFEQYIEEYL